jgi:uncharacterized protein (TIGR03435 family)
VGQTISTEFEVAEIKPAYAPKGASGIRWTGLRVDFINYPLLDLVANAYRVKNYRVAGSNALKESRVDIVAKVPSSSTAENVNEMLQTFLVREFGA